MTTKDARESIEQEGWIGQGEQIIEPGQPYLLCLGETDEIGASCHYLHLDGTGILLDAGADPEAEGIESVPDLALIRDRTDAWVDHVIVTHAHHDHLGSLPVVIRQFPHVLVHMTRATRDLANILLPSSARLQVRKLKEGSTTAEPLFDTDELSAYEYLYLTPHLEIPFDLTGVRGGTHLEARLFDAGHVLGAAGVEIETEEDPPRRIFYTSDTSLRPQAILPGGSYPDGPFDTLILESTMGADSDAENTTRKTEERLFGQALQASLDAGGTVLIPVFALGRSQEVLAMIDRFKRRRLIDPDVPVYTAGMMRAISDVYDKTRYTTPRMDNEFEVYGVEQRRLPRGEAGLTKALMEPGIFVVGSGMMFERTISNRIAQELVSDEKNAILLVGYAREDSPARRLLDAEGPDAEVLLSAARGPQPLKAAVGRFRFSGHSHRRELLELVERLDPARVLLVHGDADARQWMADNISYFNPDIEIVLPKRGEAVPLFSTADVAIK